MMNNKERKHTFQGYIFTNNKIHTCNLQYLINNQTTIARDLKVLFNYTAEIACISNL